MRHAKVLVKAFLIFYCAKKLFRSCWISHEGFDNATEKIAPFWVCAIVSSLVLAAGHIATGNIGIVVFDIANVFIDSMLFSMIFRKTDNCVISTIW